MNDSEGNKVRLIASPKSWIVGDAQTQLERLAELPGVVKVVGMPDLHPGKGAPIGAAVLTEGAFYPRLAGNDIGCGMALWQLDLPAKKLKLDRWVKKLKGLERPMEDDLADRLAERGLPSSPYDRSLGTIGGGNHFAEVQTVEEVQDETVIARLGLDASHLVLLVHSGSRGLGESVLRGHLDRFGPDVVDDRSDAANAYLRGHDHALGWAQLNRTLIAERFAGMLGAQGRLVVDLSHNSITGVGRESERRWLHRKGTAPSDAGPIILPGSRGSLSYLVTPKGDQAENAYSVAHGAGRKWARSDARGRLQRRHSPDSLKRTALGGRVICDDKDLLYEEAPAAYKDVGLVVQDLVDAGLVGVAASLRPLITYKKRRIEP
ncbi:MAG: RNA ligase RtcB family protein [Planctomycetota bacterium]